MDLIQVLELTLNEIRDMHIISGEIHRNESWLVVNWEVNAHGVFVDTTSVVN